MKALEERVTFCDQNHGPTWMQQYTIALNRVLDENKRLKEQQVVLRHLLGQFNDVLAERPSSLSAPLAPVTHTWQPILSNSLTRPLEAQGLSMIEGSNTSAPCQNPVGASGVQDENPSSCLIAPTSTKSPVRMTDGLLPGLPPSSQSSAPNTIPNWSLTPINEYGMNPAFMPATCPWFSRPDLVAVCPPVPAPLDLLYGTRRNFLADEVSRGMRRQSLRDPECLASGWLTYVYSKWRVSPTPAAFQRLPHFLRPLMAQLQRGHPDLIDLIVWPQLRINMIKYWTKYDYCELIDYLSCCSKIRWPWGRDILERDAADNLRIRQDFFDVFSKESGWGLTTEFIDKYPELLEGMDVEAIRFSYEPAAPVG